MNRLTTRVALSLLICVFTCTTRAQPADTTLSPVANSKRLRQLATISSIGYGASVTGLYFAWYENSESQRFQFFNDNAEWKQIDKMGHFISTFYLSYGASRSLQWCGVKPSKADWYGALTGFAMLLPVEIMDGFSAAYGASTGDLLANSGGALLFVSQKALWNDIYLYPKISFHRTAYPPQRPEVLGRNLPEEMLKDYNGHTFWLCADMDRFMRFPRWLNLAAGYGAERMIYGRDHENKAVGLAPYRQFYFSIDLDLKSIRTRSKFLKTVLDVASIIKLPAPAIELSRQKATFRPFYF